MLFTAGVGRESTAPPMKNLARVLFQQSNLILNIRNLARVLCARGVKKKLGWKEKQSNITLTHTHIDPAQYSKTRRAREKKIGRKKKISYNLLRSKLFSGFLRFAFITFMFFKFSG
jgi:hypothetical protein